MVSLPEMKTIPPPPAAVSPPPSLSEETHFSSVFSGVNETTDTIISFYDSIRQSSIETVNQIISLLPKILEGIVVFVLGWLLGKFVQWIFIKMGEKLRLSRIWKKTGFATLLKKADISSSPSHLVGNLLKITIIMFFLRQSMKVMGFREVEEFLGSVINLIPDILVALVILLFAISAADTASSIIKNIWGIADENARKIIAIVAKNILIAFGIMAALVQIHIAAELVQTLFTALVAMLALAGGLAFGLGGKDFVRDMIDEIRKKKHGTRKKK